MEREDERSDGSRKRDVTPVHKHWSYVSLGWPLHQGLYLNIVTVVHPMGVDGFLLTPWTLQDHERAKFDIWGVTHHETNEKFLLKTLAWWLVFSSSICGNGWLIDQSRRDFFAQVDKEHMLTYESLLPDLIGINQYFPLHFYDDCDRIWFVHRSIIAVNFCDDYGMTWFLYKCINLLFLWWLWHDLIYKQLKTFPWNVLWYIGCQNICTSH